MEIQEAGTGTGLGAAFIAGTKYVHFAPLSVPALMSVPLPKTTQLLQPVVSVIGSVYFIVNTRFPDIDQFLKVFLKFSKPHYRINFLSDALYPPLVKCLAFE